MTALAKTQRPLMSIRGTDWNNSIHPLHKNINVVIHVRIRGCTLIFYVLLFAPKGECCVCVVSRTKRSMTLISPIAMAL